MGEHDQPDQAEHPLENQPAAVDEAQEKATEDHKRSAGEAREPYASTSSNPDEAWDRATG